MLLLEAVLVHGLIWAKISTVYMQLEVCVMGASFTRSKQLGKTNCFFEKRSEKLSLFKRKQFKFCRKSEQYFILRLETKRNFANQVT